MNNERIAVIGAGTMGAGIAGQSALCGMQTILFDIDDAGLKSGLTHIQSSYNKGLTKGKLSQSEINDAQANLTTSSDLDTALQNATIVIEAVPENLELKRSLFKQFETLTSKETILASNTSSLSISAIATDLSVPDRVIGLHFFNPVAVMKLLEIVKGNQTNAQTISRSIDFALRMKKEHIIVKDSPGFATSRLGIALGNEAMRMYQEGVASAEDIDKAMSLGYRHPIGPLALSDLVGLDVRLAITKHLHAELGTDTFKPARVLEELVAAGHLGRKTG
ncbi:MAG: 3-hydroxyacyl-CoA dehydrogenase family protein, partial [Bradymonadia bacterium]